MSQTFFASEGRTIGSWDSDGKFRYAVLTTLHKGCGGQVLSTAFPSYKTIYLKQDGTSGCCLCGKQPLSPDDTFEDYR